MNALVVYWTGTGNTEIMAEKIHAGLIEAGVSADLKMVHEVTATDLDQYDKVAFGCPSMGIENLEEEEFEPFFMDCEEKLPNKKIALFGSYGWGDGEWMDYWEDRVRNLGVLLFEQGIKINSTPSTQEALDCVDFGKRFANF